MRNAGNAGGNAEMRGNAGEMRGQTGNSPILSGERNSISQNGHAIAHRGRNSYQLPSASTKLSYVGLWCNGNTAPREGRRCGFESHQIHGSQSI